MINREILIRSKIKSYDEFLEAFKYIDENDLIVIITKDYAYNGRYSYCCKLNNVKSFYTFIIHEDLIKNHEA